MAKQNLLPGTKDLLWSQNPLDTDAKWVIDSSIPNNQIYSGHLGYTGAASAGTISGTYNGGVLTTTSNNPTYYTGSSIHPQTPQTPWFSEEDGWGAAEAQQAAANGWMLVPPAYGTDTPRLCALDWGSKAQMNEKETLEDVVINAITGECKIAYTILCVLSRNRSPYAKWADTCKVLAEDTYKS